MELNEAVELRISELESERRVREQEVRVAEQRIAAINERVAELKNVLEMSAGQAIREEVALAAVPEGNGNSSPMKPSAAIFALLQSNSQGLTSAEIADSLEGKITTNASDWKNTIHSTLYNLKQSKKVIYDAETKIYTINPAKRGNNLIDL